MERSNTVAIHDIVNIAIREASHDDAPTICSFLSDMEETVFDFLIFEKYYVENLRKANNIYLVAVDAGKVVGFLSCHGQILLHHLGKVFEIQELYVDANYRSEGIGAKLVETLEAIIALEDYKSLEVTPKTKRIDAHRFYGARGFKETHFKFTKEKR